MATATDTRTVDAPDVAGLLFGHRRRVTVHEYHRMIEAGIYGPDDRVELIEGVVVDKMGKNPPHILANDLIQYLLTRLLPRGYFVSMSNPVAISERDSEPEPDASVVRGEPRDYAGRLRTSADAALVIEVADTSLAIDRRVKTTIYAAAGVPVYWLLDLKGRTLEVRSAPVAGGPAPAYAKCETFAADQDVPLLLDGVERARFRLGEVLP